MIGMFFKVVGVATCAGLGGLYYIGKCDAKYFASSSCPETNTFRRYTFTKPRYALLGSIQITDPYKVTSDNERKISVELVWEKE